MPFNREPAPELEALVDLESLTAINRYEAKPLAAQPHHRFAAAPHQQLDQVRVGTILGHARHVVEELVFGVGTEVGTRDLLLGQIGHQFAQVIDTVIGKTDGTGGKSRVAPRFVFRRAFEHHDTGTALARGQRGAHGRITRTDDGDIALIRQHCLLLVLVLSHITGTIRIAVAPKLI